MESTDKYIDLTQLHRKHVAQRLVYADDAINDFMRCLGFEPRESSKLFTLAGSHPIRDRLVLKSSARNRACFVYFRVVFPI
jgi:hypothetical protein